MTTSIDLRVALPIGSLDAYIESVNRIPLLDAEEERRLATRFRNNNDLEAARKLVMSHLRFVIKVARGYAGYGLPQSDLIQEGNIGLMKAVKRFDPEIGVRLVSFAIHWVRAEIHEYVLRNWRIVKIATTKAQRKLFFNLRNAKKRLGWMNPGEVEEVAKELGVTPQNVMEMERRLGAYDASFDTPADDLQTSPENFLQDTRYQPEILVEEEQNTEKRHSRLNHALAELDPRSREIVTSRWLNESKTTLQELANAYGVSPERIRQLEKNAFKKLKAAIEDAALPVPA